MENFEIWLWRIQRIKWTEKNEKRGCAEKNKRGKRPHEDADENKYCKSLVEHILGGGVRLQRQIVEGKIERRKGKMVNKNRNVD